MTLTSKRQSSSGQGLARALAFVILLQTVREKLRSRRWPLVVGDLLPAVGDVLTTNEQATPKISLQAIAAQHVLWLREQHWPSWFRAVHGSTVTAGVVDFSATIFIRDLA